MKARAAALFAQVEQSRQASAENLKRVKVMIKAAEAKKREQKP